MGKVVALLVFDGFRNDSRVLKEAMSLREHGYSVRVLASREEGLPDTELKQGVEVVRIEIRSGRGEANGIAKVLRYLRYYVQAARACRRVDVVQCNDLLTLPTALLLRLLRGRAVRIIYDAHEYETETNWLKGWRQRVAKIIERFLIRFADRVITVSESIADAYERDYGIRRPAIVLNAPPVATVGKTDLLREEMGIRRDTVIFLYQGGLSPNRGIEVLLEAFDGFEDDAALVFLGYGPLVPLIVQKTGTAANVYYHQAVPFERLLDYTASADFGLSLIENTCKSYNYCLPNKLFEYAMAGIPVVVSNLFELSQAVNRFGIGLIAEEHTPWSIRQTISQALSIDRSRFDEPLRLFRDRFNWGSQERAYLAAISRDFNVKQ